MTHPLIVVITSTMLAGAIIGFLIGLAACKGDQERNGVFCPIKLAKYTFGGAVGWFPMLFVIVWFVIKEHRRMEKLKVENPIQYFKEKYPR